MPQLQILNRETDPGVGVIQQGVQGITDLLRKKKEDAYAKDALKVKSMQVAINAKNAESEAEKIKLNRIKDGIDFMIKLKEQGADPNLYLPAMKNAFGEEDTMLIFQQAGEALSQAKGSAEDRLKEAKIKGQEAQTRLMTGEGMPSGTMSLEPNIGNNLRIESLQGGQQGGLRLKQISPSGPTFADPGYAYTETKMREQAKLESEVRPALTAIDAYTKQFDKAVAEMGGLGSTALGAWTKGTLKGYEANVGRLPEIQAFNKLKQPVSLTLASFMNRGRPTEPDREAAEKILEDIRYPARTNEALSKFRQEMFSSYGGVPTENRYITPIVENAGRLLIDKAKAFVDKARKQGISEEAINQVLDEYYKSLGY